jgi:PAS domain S-box-containing protein
MAAEHAGTWRDLVGRIALGGQPEDTLAASLPLLSSLTDASGLVVMRQQGETWVAAHTEGTALPTEDLDAALSLADLPDGPCDVPAGWAGVSHVQCRRLPGHLGVLLGAWAQAPGEWTDVALDLLCTGLGRLEAEERYADLAARVDNAQMLANMGDYDWHIESDTNRWSDQLYRIYGYEPQSFNPSYERFLSFIHPDDQERISGIHQQAYATGEPYAMIERIVRPEGEVRYLSSNGQVIMDESGRPVRMRGTCIDITDRVRAEEERERSSSRFRNLVESSPDAILVLGTDGSVLLANGRAHELLGGDPVGHDFASMVHQDEDRADGAVRAEGIDGRPLLLDVTMADLSAMPGDEVAAAFLHDAVPRLRNEALAAAVRESQVRRRQAMEINDNVVQGLSTSLYALRDEDAVLAESLLDRTLHAARQMMSDLLEPVEGDEIKPGDLVRSTPSHLGGASA